MECLAPARRRFRLRLHQRPALGEPRPSRRFVRWELGADGTRVELVADLVKQMKADLSPVYVPAVRPCARSGHYDGKPFDKRAFPADAAEAA